jgi:hypothetical protein
MASYLRSILPFAATVAVASVLSTAPPASAAESTYGVHEIGSASARATSPGFRHRTAQRIRFAAPRDPGRDRYVRPVHSGPVCSGAWCGRQFVLMIGIAY